MPLASGGLPPAVRGAGSEAETTARALARLRWRCRRGMLENDLILARFLDRRGETLAADDIAALERLLELGDNELWDLLSGRAETLDAVVRPLVAALRES